MRKLICLLLCCLTVLAAVTGCKSEVGSKGRLVRYDIPSKVTNLDPQYATDPSARLIIRNINEGLLIRESDGSLSPGVAESWSISDDKLKLSFKLREDAEWQDGTPLTAGDFVFAFRRIFSKDAPSPYAQDYIAIENARELTAGTVMADKLGVVAVSDHELDIYLAHPSPYFPELLADTSAMPCNEEFFTESRGRYGLDRSFVNANGPFYLERWNDESVIYLRPNSKYHSERQVLSTGVNLYINDEDAMARLEEGLADMDEISFENAEKLKAGGYTLTEMQNTVWCIVFNQDKGIWGNPLLRQGLSQTIEQELLNEKLSKKLSLTNLFVPPTCLLADKNYRSYVEASPISFDPEYGRKLFDMGLSALSIDSVSDTSFYIPDSAEHKLTVGMLQQSWQKHLSAYINVEAEPIEKIKERFLTGDYEMLLMPLTPNSLNAAEMLSMFSIGSQENKFGYNNELFDSQLRAAAEATTFEEAADACARAESLLLQDAVLIPVYIEKTVFAVSPNIRGMTAAPFSADLYFKHAEK